MNSYTGFFRTFRLALILCATALPGVVSAADEATMVVYKTPTCGCCTKWVDHLRAAGFEVEVNTVANTREAQQTAGVPRAVGSCHTATIGGYFVEGHVPADLVQRLLAEQPEGIRGIAVPGMPLGSPGMEAPNPEVYDVIAYGSDGQFYRYATVKGVAAE